MEHLEGKQYSQYPMQRNPRAYMSMRDYRNIPWQNQRPVERNPNPNRSMRDYRDQWMSAPVYSVPPQYAPPPHPQYASSPQLQPPQLISSVEQAILNLSKLVDNFIEEQRVVNVQANQEIDTVESSLNKELDGFQNEIDQKVDILQQSISKLTNQHGHQEEGSQEEECLSETIDLKLVVVDLMSHCWMWSKLNYSITSVVNWDMSEKQRKLCQIFYKGFNV